MWLCMGSWGEYTCNTKMASKTLPEKAAKGSAGSTVLGAELAARKKRKKNITIKNPKIVVCL